MNVDRFHVRAEATGKQYGYINNLCRKVNLELEAVLVELWGMPLTAAFSDRPWMRLTKREASKVIQHLLERQKFNQKFDSYVENFQERTAQAEYDGRHGL